MLIGLHDLVHIRGTYLLTVVLSLVGVPVLAQSPTSVIGDWQMDYPRTVAEYLEGTPKLKSLGETREARIAALRASFTSKAKEVPGSRITISFTEDTMTTVDMYGKQVFSYIEVGGNAGMAILQMTNASGQDWLMTIQFIESGLAIKPTDCDTYPQQCEEVQEHNQARAKQSQLANGVDLFSIDNNQDLIPNSPSVAYFVLRE